MTADRPTFVIEDIEAVIDEPDDATRERATRALRTMPRIDAVIFRMMVLRGLSAARTGRRLHMPTWCARRRLLAAIAHIDRVMRGKADP